MGKFTGDSKKLLEYVRGRESIAAIPYCVARMCFVLNDPSKADTQTIENPASARGTFTQAGQFQVVIGSEMSTFYNSFAEVAGIEGVSKDTVKKVAVRDQTLLRRIMSSLVEIFAPLIPAIIVEGLTLGFRSIIGETALFNGGTKTLTQIFVSWAGINSFLWLIGGAVFHFLLMRTAWPITKKMGTTQTLGIVLGITLVSPRLLNTHSVVTTATAEMPKWNFGLFQVDMAGYQAQALPAVLVGLTLVYLERFFRKMYPAIIFMIATPFCSLMISVVVAHGILRPVGWKIGAVASDCVDTSLASLFKGVSAGIFGLFYVPFVITELHHISNAIDLRLIADFGDTTLQPMIALSNIVQGLAVLAMILFQKNDAEAKEVPAPTCISCYPGVTEPTIFGMNLKYGLPFICGMIGSAVGAALSVISGVKASAIGMGGMLGILPIQPQYMGLFAAVMGLVILIPFCLAYTIERKKGIGDSQGDRQESQGR